MSNPFAVPDPSSAVPPSPGGSGYGQPAGEVPAYGAPSYGSPQGVPPYGSPYGAPSPYGSPGGPSPYGPYGAPPYGSPPVGAYPPYAYPEQRSTNGMAVASMIVGIVSIVLCAFFVPAIVGLVLGIVALNQAKGREDSGGRGMAIAGVATSAVSLVLAGVFLVIGLVSDSSTSDDYYYGTQGQTTGQVTSVDA